MISVLRTALYFLAGAGCGYIIAKKGLPIKLARRKSTPNLQANNPATKANTLIDPEAAAAIPNFWENEDFATMAERLIQNGYAAEGSEIELMSDILGWCNKNLETLRHAGATEINVIKGGPLLDDIKFNNTVANSQRTINLNEELLNNSVVIVPMNNRGEIVFDIQLISAPEGISDDTDRAFAGNTVLTIKI